MRVVVERPPLFAEIDAAFGIADRPIFFAWGDVIYNPRGVEIPPALMSHEAVHGQRQGTDPETWWRRYIADPIFRLDEEIVAHQAEWRAFRRLNRDRNERVRYLGGIAGRLAGPLYGCRISRETARRLIERAG